MEMEELQLLRGNLLRSLNEDHVILFVGRRATLAALPDALLSQPWSCIVTSHRAPAAGDRFRAGKTCGNDLGELAELRFNERVKPIVYLFNQADTEGEAPLDDDDLEDAQQDAARALERIFAKMDLNSHLVVIGYDATGADPRELKSVAFTSYLRQNRRRITFFAGEAADERTARFREKMAGYGVAWHDCTLADVLASEDDGEEAAAGVHIAQRKAGGMERLYVHGERVLVDHMLRLRNSGVAELLTEEVLRPSGEGYRAHQGDKFFKFLDESSEAPQWYGYFPATQFYVRRTFEAPLCALVEDLLNGQNPAQQGPQDSMPLVVLHGAPCSSKSVELAALAYQMFEKHQHPVVYLRKKDVVYHTKSDEWEQLKELLRVVGNLGDARVRTLVLWDSSSFQNAVELAERLRHSLVDQGRRFVLVCTAYEQNLHADEAPEKARQDLLFRYNAGKKGEPAKGPKFSRLPERLPEGTVPAATFHDGRFYIRAPRKMERDELVQLRYRLKDFVISDKAEIDRRLDILGEFQRTDIFAVFYQLIATLRRRLEDGLTREQKAVDQYVREQCEKIAMAAGGFRKDAADNPFAGLRELFADEDDDEDDDIGEAPFSPEDASSFRQRLEAFSTCIAMFSQFGESAPFPLAFRMLCDYTNEAELYTEENIRRLKITVEEMTYLYQGRDAEGDDVFRFRMPLEAEYYLRSNDIDAQKQCALVEQMLDIYAAKADRDSTPDPQVGNAILDLLERLGPNGNFDTSSHAQKNVHNAFLCRMDKVIEKLEDVRRRPGADPQRKILDLEITFAREYYGARGEIEKIIWPETRRTWQDYQDRLEHLSQTNDLATERLAEITREQERDLAAKHNNFLRRKRHRLTNEQAHCNIRIDQLKKELRDKLREAAPANMEDLLAQAEAIPELPYSEIYGKLNRVVAEDPSNGYYYNALFHAFKNEYANLVESHQDAKRQKILGDILMNVEDAKSSGIMNRGMNGRDELGPMIADIVKLREKDVRIDDIHDGTCSAEFRETFDWMLDEKNPSALCMISREELYAAGIERPDARDFDDDQDDRVLTPAQADACKKIMDFLHEDRHQLCIDRRSSALYFQLRVTWMYYDKWRLNWKKEWQLTQIEDAGWRELLTIADKYHARAEDEHRETSYPVELLRVLANAQLGDYATAARLLAVLEHRKQADGQTYRMHVPYVLCDGTTGRPRMFVGDVKKPEEGALPFLMSVRNEGETTPVVKEARFSPQRIGKSSRENLAGLRIQDVSIGPSFAGSWAACVYRIMKGGRAR